MVPIAGESPLLRSLKTIRKEQLSLLFGSDANSIRNLCSPVGVCVYVCMWTCNGILTVDVYKSIPRPRLPKQWRTIRPRFRGFIQLSRLTKEWSPVSVNIPVCVCVCVCALTNGTNRGRKSEYIPSNCGRTLKRGRSSFKVSLETC